MTKDEFIDAFVAGQTNLYRTIDGFWFEYGQPYIAMPLWHTEEWAWADLPTALALGYVPSLELGSHVSAMIGHGDYIDGEIRWINSDGTVELFDLFFNEFETVSANACWPFKPKPPYHPKPDRPHMTITHTKDGKVVRVDKPIARLTP